MPTKIANKFLSKIIIRNIDPLIKKDKMMERATTIDGLLIIFREDHCKIISPRYHYRRTDAIAIYKRKHETLPVYTTV